MKRSNLIFAAVFAAVFATILAGCEKQAQPVVNIPVPATAPAAPAIPLDKVETKLGGVAVSSVDGMAGARLPEAGSVIPVSGDSFEIAGFAVDKMAGRPAAGVVIMVDETPFVAIYGGDRPDIAKALNNPDFLKSQFYAKIPTTSFSAGLHDVAVRVIAADRSGYYESKWSGKVSIAAK